MRDTQFDVTLNCAQPRKRSRLIGLERADRSVHLRDERLGVIFGVACVHDKYALFSNRMRAYGSREAPTQQLCEPERASIIERRSFAMMSPRVEYSLTAQAWDLG
jgi:hypothetical protein